MLRISISSGSYAANKMNKKSIMIKKSFFFLVAILTLNCTLTQSDNDTTTPKALYIIVDGISTDVLESTPTPTIDAISANGGFNSATTGGKKNGYSQSPTASAIGYNNVLTGTWANKHNVYTNGITAPNYNYYSLYRLIHEQSPDLTTALFSSWTDNRTKLIGEGLEEAGGVPIDFIRDGYDLDLEEFPQDSGWVQKVDTKVAMEAAEVILSEGPDFSWVYLWYTDDTGHIYGEDERHRTSIMYADSLVGIIYDAVLQRQQQLNEDWLVAVTTDHGRGLPNGYGHGGQSEREREVWFAVQSTELNPHFNSAHLKHVDLYPTIAKHLNISIPDDQRSELDGIPFIGSVVTSHLSTRDSEQDNTVIIEWDYYGMSEAEKGILSYSLSDEFSTGGNDEYSSIAEVNLSNEAYEWVIPDTVVSNGFEFQDKRWVKVLLETSEHKSNIWIELAPQ